MDFGFFSLYATFARLGYAVLLVNYRGSLGFGQVSFLGFGSKARDGHWRPHYLNHNVRSGPTGFLGSTAWTCGHHGMGCVLADTASLSFSLSLYLPSVMIGYFYPAK